MKNIILYITIACSLTVPSYAMQTEPDTSGQQRQRSSFLYHQKDPDEMMRRFKQATPLAELQRLQALAKQILADAKKQEEECIAAVVSRIVAY